jgi:hypothetical protein
VSVAYVRALNALTALEYLELVDHHGMGIRSMLAPLNNLSALTEVVLRGSASFSSVAPYLAGMAQLQVLCLGQCSS